MDDRIRPESTRREGVPSTPAVLADGRAWGLALPTVRYRPVVEAAADALGRPSVRIGVASRLGFPPEVDEALRRLDASRDRGPDLDRYRDFFGLASALLRHAHDIDRATARALLDVPDDALAGLVRAVLSAVSGTTAPPGAGHDLD